MVLNEAKCSNLGFFYHWFCQFSSSFPHPADFLGMSQEEDAEDLGKSMVPSGLVDLHLEGLDWPQLCPNQSHEGTKLSFTSLGLCLLIGGVVPCISHHFCQPVLSFTCVSISCAGPQLWGAGKGVPQKAKLPAEAMRLKVAGVHFSGAGLASASWMNLDLLLSLW